MAGNGIGVFAAGIEAELSQAIGGLVPQIPGQTFRNKPVVNRKPAVYQLVVREPEPSQAIVTSFVFPISPSGIRRRSMSVANVYDVAGSFKEEGVHRIIDEYGNTPPTFVIVGTTGWQRHGSDGYRFTGLEAYRELRKVFVFYATLNAGQVQQGLPDLYRMEFYDFFANQFWEVAPIGEQEYSQDRQKPLLVNFRISLAATKPLNQPPLPKQDALGSAFGRTLSQAASNLGSAIGDLFDDYTTVTIQTDPLIVISNITGINLLEFLDS